MVCLTFPGQAAEIWRVCRTHDRELKNLAVASRTSLEPTPDSSPAPTVHCEQCDSVLQEPVSADQSTREPCPKCGSTARTIHVSCSDTVYVHESLRVQSRGPGKGKWLKDVKSGDDYTRALQAWGERTLELSREDNQYRQLIKLFDGTEIESSARLSDHHD
jgi:phage FluMu protein Com